ncbi:hypothetical protein J2Z48_000127 [Croceifilum oryzae]|uniref:Lipoprotein n=1 Tax=Croceifilum oryzae TaxID=1553429 RepID=A0AAJ1TH27_9BACL|nr:DUF6612 family protein [Croceifilum oryzae]MDQ0415969.1 hypothetical protein [Croceifilum oryzae]
MKTWIRSTSILMLSTALLVGCQTKDAAKPEKAKDAQTTVETKKELTTDELINKIEESKKAHTYQLSVKGTLSFAGKQVQFEENSKVEEVIKPKAMHKAGTSTSLGTSEKVESYEKDGLTYSYQEKKKTWTKTKATKETSDPFSHMDTSIQSFKSMKEAVSSSHEGNQYKVVFDISKSKNRSALEKELASTFTQDNDPQTKALFKGMKLKSYTVTFTFDDKTFAQTSLEGSLELATDSKTKPTMVKATIKQNQFAPFNGSITIPADVVKKAKSS